MKTLIIVFIVGILLFIFGLGLGFNLLLTGIGIALVIGAIVAFGRRLMNRMVND